MEAQDHVLIHTLSLKNPDFGRLVAEHRELDERLGRIEKQRSLTPAERAEVKRLKRRKLARRDRIEAVLARHR